jgi:hypothetical protein
MRDREREREIEFVYEHMEKLYMYVRSIFKSKEKINK